MKTFVKVFCSIIALLVVFSTVGPNFVDASFGCEEKTFSTSNGIQKSGVISLDPREGGCTDPPGTGGELDPGTGTGTGGEPYEDIYIPPGTSDAADTMKLISDNGTSMVYQVEEDGAVYEYHEKIIETTSGVNVETDKYLVIGATEAAAALAMNKELVDSQDSLIKYNSLNNTITVIDTATSEVQGEVVLGKETLLQEANKDVYYNFEAEPTTSTYTGDEPLATRSIKKGGSKIAAMWYEIPNYKRQATAIKYPNYKYVDKYNWRFVDYRNKADNIRAAEWSLVTGGLSAILTEVAKMAKAGKWITIARVKVILKQAGRAIPGFGTLIGIVSWGISVYHANKAYKAIIGVPYSSY